MGFANGWPNQARKKLLRPDGILVATIDDYQYRELNFILEENFGRSNIAGTVVIRIDPSGRPLPQGFAQSHEYAIFAKSTSQAVIESLPRSDKQNARYKHRDDDGRMYMWELFRKRGSNSEQKDRPSLYYPIYVSGDTMRVPAMEYDDQQKIWHIHESPRKLFVYPIDDAGTHRTWRGQPDALRTKPSDYTNCKIEDGVVTIYYKFRPDSEAYCRLRIGLMQVFGNRAWHWLFEKILHRVQRILISKVNLCSRGLFAGSWSRQ